MNADHTTSFDIDELLDNKSINIIVCCGSGGVGKTTTSAALGLRAAERGRRVCVMTIDPARRLAQSLGLEHLDNTPRQIPEIGAAEGGALFAMMLDMKRTFDEIVEQHADPERAREILANSFYQTLSSSFAGTQEYMAMEKLGQLHRQAEDSGIWDLVIVDTPPSRSALDFLDAPERLGSFLDGRLIRLLMAPARAGGRAYMRVVGAGFSLVASALTKILGAQLLTDLQTLVAGLDSVFGGFRERAEKTYALLQDSGSAFVVVAAPEPDALREASYFVERLQEDAMPLGRFGAQPRPIRSRGGCIGRSSCRRGRSPRGAEGACPHRYVAEAARRHHANCLAGTSPTASVHRRAPGRSGCRCASATWRRSRRRRTANGRQSSC